MIVNRMQLPNQGHRDPGVVNTDAHDDLHGSGWLRNDLGSPTDAPAEVDVMDMVPAAEAGQVVMTNGPLLEVVAPSNGPEAIPGGILGRPAARPRSPAERVQCPNWLDVDRVQVFVNGRAAEDLNLTRASTPGALSDGDGAERFDREIPLALEAGAYVIVAAIGEGSRLGPVIGGGHADDRPVAVSNPIFIDADGGGFAPSKETLGAPLPTKAN